MYSVGQTCWPCRGLLPCEVFCDASGFSPPSHKMLSTQILIVCCGSTCLFVDVGGLLCRLTLLPFCIRKDERLCVIQGGSLAKDTDLLHCLIKLLIKILAQHSELSICKLSCVEHYFSMLCFCLGYFPLITYWVFPSFVSFHVLILLLQIPVQNPSGNTIPNPASAWAPVE